MNTITYKDIFGTTGEIPLGQNYQLLRQDGDIVIARDVSHSLPIKVAIQITTDGKWQWWYSKMESGHGNPYWHFSNTLTKPPSEELRLPACTDAQRETLNKMQSGEIDIFGLRGALGGPVIEWAFGERAEEVARAYHD